MLLVCSAIALQSALSGSLRSNGNMVHTATKVPPAPAAPSALSSACSGMSLEELRALLCMRRHALVEQADPSAAGGCSPELWATRSLHATRLPNLPLANCHLARSGIPGAGNGCFASADIASGALITLYPGDALRIDSTLTGYNHVSCCAAADDGSLYLPPAALLARARDYEIEVASTADAPLSAVLGDPERVESAAYLGHMLNDGATCHSESYRSVYASESARARNAAPVQVEGCHLAIVATRDVCEGEELLLTYGAPYWLAQLGMGTPTDNGAHSSTESSTGPSRRRRRRRRTRGDWPEAEEEEEESAWNDPPRPRCRSSTRGRRGGRWTELLDCQ